MIFAYFLKIQQKNIWYRPEFDKTQKKTFDIDLLFAQRRKKHLIYRCIWSNWAKYTLFFTENCDFCIVYAQKTAAICARDCLSHKNQLPVVFWIAKPPACGLHAVLTCNYIRRRLRGYKTECFCNSKSSFALIFFYALI